MRTRMVRFIAVMTIVLLLAIAMPGGVGAVSHSGTTVCANWYDGLYINTFDNIFVHNAYGSASFRWIRPQGCNLYIDRISVFYSFSKNGNVVRDKNCEAVANNYGDAEITTSSCYDGGASRPGSFRTFGHFYYVNRGSTTLNLVDGLDTGYQ